MFAEIQKRDEQRNEERKEADRKARLEDRADERKWQVEQKESDRRWQLEQKWKDRIFAIALALGGFLLGWLFSREKPTDIRPEIHQEKNVEPPKP